MNAGSAHLRTDASRSNWYTEYSSVLEDIVPWKVSAGTARTSAPGARSSLPLKPLASPISLHEPETEPQSPSVTLIHSPLSNRADRPGTVILPFSRVPQANTNSTPPRNVADGGISPYPDMRMGSYHEESRQLRSQAHILESIYPSMLTIEKHYKAEF